MYDLLGYYVTCDDAVCSHCATIVNQKWPGFEDWDEPIPIFRDTELDSPVGCSECGSLIPVRLTEDGYNYVVEEIRDYLKSGPSLNSAHIYALWGEYGDTMVHVDLLEIVKDVDTDELKDFIWKQIQEVQPE